MHTGGITSVSWTQRWAQLAAGRHRPPATDVEAPPCSVAGEAEVPGLTGVKPDKRDPAVSLSSPLYSRS